MLKTCHTYNFYFIIIGLIDPENMGVDAKIVFPSDIEANILPKTKCNYFVVGPFCFWPQ